MSFLKHLLPGGSDERSRAVRAYERHLDEMLRQHRDDPDLAYAKAIGAATRDLFEAQGDGHVAVLRANGLTDGMTVFDLGCGCGRTAQALQRAGWQGQYTGVDIIQRFVEHLERRSPGYRAFVHRTPSIPAETASLDMVFHWSVFTHLSPEECYLYLQDTFRALKPGGTLVFSFLEMSDPAHHRVFFTRVERLAQGKGLAMLDAFLHRDWITTWAEMIGFSKPQFVDGSDGSRYPPTWQAVATIRKPG